MMEDASLPEDYDYRQVKVRSTDIDRTLASAHALLDGLYPGFFIKNIFFFFDSAPLSLSSNIEKEREFTTPHTHTHIHGVVT